MFINDYFNEYSEPKMVIETTWGIDNFSQWNKYQFSYLKDKQFIPLSYEKDLLLNTNKVKLREL